MCSFFQVNLIQLRPEHERLRDSVFWAVFKNAILVDDLESAIKYRKYLTDEKRSCPVIYTLAGDRMETHGMLDPTIGAGRLPENLEYVYGQQSFGNSTACKDLHSGKCASCSFSSNITFSHLSPP
jgi:hypothetical protein